MKLSKYIACICEGTAEQVIMDLLLNDDRLKFTYENLLEGKLLRCRKAYNFERLYLRKGFTEGITILRILDSRREQFKLSKAYIHKVNVINIITAPEIEILVILKEGKYKEFKKSRKKPSEFCASDLRLSNVKSEEFIRSYFRDTNLLVDAIVEYRRVSNVKNGEYSLADLLKNN